MTCVLTHRWRFTTGPGELHWPEFKALADYYRFCKAEMELCNAGQSGEVEMTLLFREAAEIRSNSS